MAAFINTSKDGLHFKSVPKLRADLISSRAPVIICAAPAQDSPHASGRRLFADLQMDRKGMPRKVTGAATHIKKKAQPSRQEVLSLSDSDIEVVSKGKGNSCNPLAELYKSDDIQEIQPPTEGIQSCWSQRKRAVAQSPIGTIKMETTADGAEVNNLSSPSGSEYVPDPDNKAAAVVAQNNSQDASAQGDNSSEDEAEPLPHKPKPKGDISSCAVKKRMFVELVSKTSWKGKRKASPSGDGPSHKKHITVSSASSGDEGTTARKPSTSVRIAEPDCQDGPTDDSIPLVMSEVPARSTTSLPDAAISARTPSTTTAPTPTVSNSTQLPPILPVSSKSERPKPHLVTKADCHLTVNEDDPKAFSLHAKKRVQDAPATVQETDPLSIMSANLLAIEEGRVGSNGKANVSEEDRVPTVSKEEYKPTWSGENHIPSPSDEERRGVPSNLCLAPDSGPHCLDPCNRAATSDHPVPQVKFPLHQSHDPPHQSHNHHAYVLQFPPGEHVPFAGGGWYGLPPDPRMQGYAGPFMGYPPWGVFPKMDDPAHQHGYFPGAQVQGRYNGGPTYEGYEGPGPSYYYHSQLIKCPPPNLHATWRATYPDAMGAGPSNVDSGDCPNGYPTYPVQNQPALPAPRPVHNTHVEGDK